MKNFILLLLSTLLFASCASSYVSLEPMGATDQHVNITAIGEKKVYKFSNVSLPYRFKAKEYPLRVTIDSPNNIYPDFTAAGEKVDVGMGMFGLGMGTICGSIGALAFASGGAPIIGGVLLTPAAGMWLYAGGKELLQSKQLKLYIEPTPVTEANKYRISPEWRKSRDEADLYTLLEKGSYGLARNKATYLLNKRPSAELYYLRGVAQYNLTKYKDALRDFQTALSYTESDNMKSTIYQYIAAAENGRAARAEERRQQWASVAAAFAGVASGVAAGLQNQQTLQGAAAPMGASNLSGKAYLLDPNYIKVQYLQETNNGSTMTFEQWLNIKSPVSSGGSSESTTESYSDSNYSRSSKSSSGKICDSCKGDGKCIGCHGSTYSTDNQFGTGVHYDKKCSVCGGTGRCTPCSGTGRRP